MKGALIIVVFVIIVVAIVVVMLAKTNKTENIENMEEVARDLSSMELSPFDINVKVPTPGADFIELWKAEMARIGLEVEFHPDFNIKSQKGFLPFKLLVTDSSFTTKYAQEEWLAGFELYISDFDREDFYSYYEPEDLESIPNNIKKLYDNAELDFYFSAQPNNNTAEYRMTWYAASALTKVCNGILVESYSGEQFTSSNVVETAINKTKKVETELKTDEWKLSKFVEWN